VLWPWTEISQRRAWKRAQRLHAFEHAAGIDRTLDCKAVAHYELTDDYSDYFDDDNRRRFCLATGRTW
jgi:hypothetical protein